MQTRTDVAALERVLQEGRERVAALHRAAPRGEFQRIDTKLSVCLELLAGLPGVLRPTAAAAT